MPRPSTARQSAPAHDRQTGLPPRSARPALHELLPADRAHGRVEDGGVRRELRRRVGDGEQVIFRLADGLEGQLAPQHAHALPGPGVVLALPDHAPEQVGRLRLARRGVLGPPAVGLQGNADGGAGLAGEDRHGRLAQVLVDQRVVPQGAGGADLDAVDEAVVALDHGDQLLHARVVESQAFQRRVAGPHPEGQAGAVVAVKRGRLDQQGLEVACPEELLDWLSRIVVHRAVLLSM